MNPICTSTRGSLVGLLLIAGCSSSEAGTGAIPNGGGANGLGGGFQAGSSVGGSTVATGGAAGAATGSSFGGPSGGFANQASGGSSSGGSSVISGGASSAGASSFGGASLGGQTQGVSGGRAGAPGLGGRSGSAGNPAGGSVSNGGAVATSGGSFNGGVGNGGVGNGGAMNGGSGNAGAPGGGAGPGPSSSYPCDGTTSGYNAVATKSGSTWTVVNGGREVYSGTDMQQALTRAYASLTSGRTSKQSVLVLGSGDIPASAQVSIPSYTVLNVCGTINVSGTPSGSDRSPLYARNARDIEIPNLKMTGSPQYGIFFRQTNNIHLGQIDLRLSSGAGIGVRIDSGPSASTQTTFNENLTIDYVYGSGMGSHIVETYGISKIKVGTVEGNEVGECGLLLNRSINAEIGLVKCTNCATGTGYAAFRVANSVGKVGSDFPAGNIHVGKVYARGGGRGIFSVSGSGGLTIDEIDIADTGSTPILLQNAYNTTIAAKSGTVSKGLVQLSNDTDNTNEGVYPPSKNVALQNLTLSNGASVRQDWCAQYGKNGCSASNITGGSVSMCP